MTSAHTDSTRDRLLEEALAYVYIAQYVRVDGPERAGVLSQDCQRYYSQLEVLLTNGEIQRPTPCRTNAYLPGFVTTPQGTEAASRIVEGALRANADKLSAEFGRVPPRLLKYLFEEVWGDQNQPARAARLDWDVGRGDSLPPQSANPTYHCILAEREVTDVRDRLFRLFSQSGFMVTATSYAIVTHSPIRDRRYVPADELEAFWEDYLEDRGLAGRLWPLELEEMHIVFHQLDSGEKGFLQGRAELERSIPVFYRDAANNFLDECLRRKAITEGTLRNGDPCFNLADKLWYDTSRAERFKKPLLDFLLDRGVATKAGFAEGQAEKQVIVEPVIESLLRTEPPKPDEQKKDQEKKGGEQPPPKVGFQILLGDDVFWKPTDERNPHALIVGTTGVGKTQTVKALVHELHQRDMPSIIFDFAADYEDLGLTMLDLKQGMAINPLEVWPPKVKGGEGRSPQFAESEIVDILTGIYHKGLGVQQQTCLRQAVSRAYTGKGIEQDSPETWSRVSPTLADVKAELKEMQGKKETKGYATTTLGHLYNIFELGLFDTSTQIPFETIMQSGAVIQLKGLPGNDLKTAACEFFLQLLWYQVSKAQSPLRLFCVIDEAHRLAYEHSPVDTLLREGRKFGVGVILASQRPRDFHETVLANVACFVSLICSFDKDAKFMASQILCKPKEIQTLPDDFSAMVKFLSQDRPVKLRISPYYERKS